MRLKVSFAVLIALSVISVSAQSGGSTNCNGLPCGSVPWGVPVFPPLASPTQIPDALVPPVNTPTPTPTPTQPFTFTTTPEFDFSLIGESVETIQALMEATDEVLYNAEGTEIVINDAPSLVIDNSALFFSYVKGFNINTFGILTPVIYLLMTSFLVALAFALVRIGLPIIMVIIKIVRVVIQFIMDFIPG